MLKKYTFLLIFSFLVVLAGCSCSQIFGSKTAPELINRPVSEDATVLRRKIDGQPVASVAATNYFPVAVMVENSVDAWPLSGLDKANIVIEAITEATIPRFVAIFASDEVIVKIGPVRSARPYYLDWIEPWQPLYMHVGGSPEALQKVRSESYKLFNFDQFFNSEYFWRDNKWRYAPHNVYTSSELIKQALEDKNLLEPLDYATWLYKNDKKLEDRPGKAANIVINYNSNFYKVTWRYNRATNLYQRYQGTKSVKMNDGAEIFAKNIIVQVNKMTVLDNVGRKKISTLGDGQAWVMRDGEVVAGTWKKESIGEITRYYHQDNKEIQLNGGTSWIEVVPSAETLQLREDE